MKRTFVDTSAWDAIEDSSDPMAFAVSQGRAVLSFNRGDFIRLHKQYLERGWEHYGIIVSPQYPIGETLRRTIHLLETLFAEDMMNRLEYLNSGRGQRPVNMQRPGGGGDHRQSGGITARAGPPADDLKADRGRVAGPSPGVGGGVGGGVRKE